jgi:xanthine dehydrogenase YagS FAD-binding subunit
VRIPAAWPGERAAYVRSISRFEAEWPLVEAVARLVIDDGTVTGAAVAVGGVATVPLRLPAVDEALIGYAPTGDVLAAAADRATDGATPLPLTRYKVDLLRGTVLDVLERATGQR